MKTILFSLALATASTLVFATVVSATTTIDPANNFAYGANLGWINFAGDTANGAIIGEYVCSGYVYSANVGWINLGSGTPANQIQYQNNSATDFGVNQDGLGNLRGYAYGANIGWINFENTGAPKVDLLTGKFSGYAYSANCGWISLSNAVSVVQTDSILKGALAPDGLPIAWLLSNFGTTNVNATADADGDGASNASEYLAGTNPNDASSVLRLNAITRGTITPTFTTLTWNSVPTRYYAVQERASLASGSWVDYITQPVLGLNNVGVYDTNAPADYFRIRAYRPLTP